ncbi:invasion associated locus B family protein [Paracoccus sp. (in: a-proteobacteria)]|uniref:invasion associated locus B family protein n=1 Tax=Paracoccus sp. TaxID=267 RepID=UPI00396CCE85
MSIKPSYALAAVLALMTAPAFAQDNAAPQSQPEAPATAQPVPQPGETAPANAPTAEQQAPAEEDATTPAPGTTDAQATAPAADADSGAEAAAEAPEQPGSYYALSEHGDWTIRCIRAGQGKDPCEMYKLLTDEDDNAVAELTLIPLSNGNVAAGATLVAPLETDLIEGLGFQVDNGEVRGYPFSFCAPVGCVSRLGFTDAELAAMKRGSRATVQLLPFGGDKQNPVELGMSLAGFTAAFDELTAYSNAPAPEADNATPEEPAETPAE